MIDIGGDTWINPDSIESVRRVVGMVYAMRARAAWSPQGKPIPDPIESDYEVEVTLRSGASFRLPSDWTVYDLFNRMCPD